MENKTQWNSKIRAAIKKLKITASPTYRKGSKYTLQHEVSIIIKDLTQADSDLTAALDLLKRAKQSCIYGTQKDIEAFLTQFKPLT